MALERLKQDGRVAIVSGGAKGVGLGIAKVLAEAGAAVAIMSRTQSDVDVAVAELALIGPDPLGMAGDVTSQDDRERLVREVIEKYGRIDILINNAGGAGPAPFDEITSKKFLDDFDFNVVQALHMTQLVAPHMSDGGSVVNISSRASQIASADMLTYSVVKSGLERMTRMLAHNLAPSIRVNAIALGTIATDALQRFLDSKAAAKDRIIRQIPLHRIGDVEDIGLATLYLCSRGCYATGSVINIDGGIEHTPIPG
tara:strand:+ start:16616 stop:17383 length:768 start_codon:yes stop_codon:yes gene_type:complete